MVFNRNIAFIAFAVIAVILFVAGLHRADVIPAVRVPESVSNLYKGATGASKASDPGKPRYIFVDLGANRADSLEAFLQHPGAKFEYDFPKPDWASHEDADIYLFEGNPTFNEDLVKAKEKYTAKGKTIQVFPSTVCDIIDGTRTFYLDTVNPNADYWGSSTYANHKDVVNSKSNGTELTAVNIARWLLMNTFPRDFVVVKMDIEGAEYDLIPHFAQMQMWAVIDHLLVEWHSWLPSEEAQVAASEAQKKLIAEGVDMPFYDSGA